MYRGTVALTGESDSAPLHKRKRLFHDTTLPWKHLGKTRAKEYHFKLCCYPACVAYLKTSDVVLESRGCGTRCEFLAGRSSSVCATEMWWCSEAWQKNKDSYRPGPVDHGAEQRQVPVCQEQMLLKVLRSQGFYESMNCKLLSNPNVIPHNSTS